MICLFLAIATAARLGASHGGTAETAPLESDDLEEPGAGMPAHMRVAEQRSAAAAETEVSPLAGIPAAPASSGHD